MRTTRRFRPAVERVEGRRLADGGGGGIVLATVFDPPPPGPSSQTTPPITDPDPGTGATVAFNLTALAVSYFYPPAR